MVMLRSPGAWYFSKLAATQDTCQTVADRRSQRCGPQVRMVVAQDGLLSSAVLTGRNPGREFSTRWITSSRHPNNRKSWPWIFRLAFPKSLDAVAGQLT